MTTPDVLGVLLTSAALVALRQVGAPWRLIGPYLGLQTLLLGNVGHAAALLTLAHITAFECLRWLREARGD
ncbi:MAG: hypothetical protein SF123_24950 [Chloroflexota bacterium]|nr:hypothetical protein [Chloroflexota bacterium]